MSLPLPISVFTKTPRGWFDLTSRVRDLSYRSTAPGGFAAAQFTFDQPLNQPGGEVDYFGRIYVIDSRSGEVLWEGWLEDPGRSAGATAGSYQLAAMGPSARAKDMRQQAIFVDRDPANWVLGAGTAKYIRVDIGAATEDGTGIVNMKTDQGATWAIGGAAGITYHKFAEIGSGQGVARVEADWDTGLTNANSEVQLLTAPGGISPTVRASATWNVAGGTLTAAMTAQIPDGDNWAFLRVIRPAVAGSGGETVWAEFTNIRVRGQLYDAAGNRITTGYTGNTVLAHEVVKHVLGRYLINSFDTASAVVATTSYPIASLVFLDGETTAVDIFDKLEEFEPGYYWAAWESGTSGKNRFEYVAWPTTPRYEVDDAAIVDLDLPSSGADLHNAATAQYRGSDGFPHQATSTSTVPELAAAGITRWGFVDMGTGVHTDVDALQAANVFLADHSSPPPAAGRLVVAAPIVDRKLGRFVYPWELRPGHLMAVRGLNPTAASLAAADRTSTFRIVSAQFDAASVAATLELDIPTRTATRALSKILTLPLISPR